MIIKNGTNQKIEKLKERLGLTGDVYVYNNHFIESLESHKKLIPNSKATDINEAFVERVQYEIEQEKLRAEEAKKQQEKD
jgi:hypothetical protein